MSNTVILIINLAMQRNINTSVVTYFFELEQIPLLYKIKPLAMEHYRATRSNDRECWAPR